MRCTVRKRRRAPHRMVADEAYGAKKKSTAQKGYE